MLELFQVLMGVAAICLVIWLIHNISTAGDKAKKRQDLEEHLFGKENRYFDTEDEDKT